MTQWGALTYTSYDSPTDKYGGWRVKEAVGLSANEMEALTARLGRPLVPIQPVPTFLGGDADRAALVRRLAVVPGSSGIRMWHEVPAGRDASGRPGNTFIHAVVDRRDVDDLGSERPVDLWRSPSWLCPFGPEEVRSATLHQELRPAAGPAQDMWLDHIFDDDSPGRPGVLSVLADALSDRMTHRSRAADPGAPAPSRLVERGVGKERTVVVLAVGGTDAGASWVAALSHMCGAPNARQLAWSTYERFPGSVDELLGTGYDLVCMPREDAVRVPQHPRVIVLDEDELPERGPDGHATAHGNLVPRTDWGSLIEASVYAKDHTCHVVEQIDDIVASIPGRRMGAAWPLALIVRAELGDDMSDDPQLATVVRRVLTTCAPHSYRPDGEQHSVVREALAALLGETAEEAATVVRMLVAAGAPVSLRSAALSTLLERAWRDRGWLGGQPGPFLPDPEAAATEQCQIAADRLYEVVPVLGEDPAGDPYVSRAEVPLLLMALDLFVRSGFDVSGDVVALGSRTAVATLLRQPGQGEAVGHEVLGHVLGRLTAGLSAELASRLEQRLPAVGWSRAPRLDPTVVRGLSGSINTAGELRRDVALVNFLDDPANLALRREAMAVLMELPEGALIESPLHVAVARSKVSIPEAAVLRRFTDRGDELVLVALAAEGTGRDARELASQAVSSPTASQEPATRKLLDLVLSAPVLMHRQGATNSATTFLINLDRVVNDEWLRDEDSEVVPQFLPDAIRAAAVLGLHRRTLPVLGLSAELIARVAAAAADMSVVRSALVGDSGLSSFESYVRIGASLHVATSNRAPRAYGAARTGLRAEGGSIQNVAVLEALLRCGLADVPADERREIHDAIRAQALGPRPTRDSVADFHEWWGDTFGDSGRFGLATSLGRFIPGRRGPRDQLESRQGDPDLLLRRIQRSSREEGDRQW